MTKQLLTEQEAFNDVSEAITSVLGKRWMVAVWCVDHVEENGKPPLDMLRLVSRTTWRFPHGNFEESLRLLRDNLDEEKQAGEPPVPSPLKMAPFALDTECVDVSDEPPATMKPTAPTADDLYQQHPPFALGKDAADEIPKGGE